MNRLLVTTLLALLVPGWASAQVFVVPRRPDKSQVRNFRFEWRHVDILVGPQAKAELTSPMERRAHESAPGTPGGATPTAPTVGEGVEQGPAAAGEPAETAPVVEAAPDAGTPAEAVDGGAVAEADAGTPTAADAETPAAADAGAPGPGADGGAPAFATSLTAATGGVRLYFYERERKVAERAVPLIEDAYRYLVDRFQYVPTETFPYILYSSYQEFLQTNLFPLQEGTLGVTSPEDLKLTLPYLGDHPLFNEVSRHELAHEFTIQKVRSISKQDEAQGDPLGELPLWFIEGLAEYYAKRGLDAEAEMLVRDLIVNPDVLRGYAYVDFFEQGPYGFLWIYKVGQARCAFLEEVYGTGTIQRVLEESARLVSGGSDRQSLGFKELLQRLTGDAPEKISARFASWLKRRSFRAYLSAEQDAPALEVLEERRGIITALNTSPDGHLLAYRSLNPDTGRSELILVDDRAPEDHHTVVTDGVPGVESLHPVFGRNFDLSDDRLVYVAERAARDVLYFETVKHSATSRTAEVLERRPSGTAVTHESAFEVDIDTDDRTEYRLKKWGLLAAHSPSFSPDGKRVAFIGLDDEGTRDVYVLTPRGDGEAELQQLTHDPFSERQLSWGPDGIVFNSDATSHRQFNLFRVRPGAPDVVERLTSEARDHSDPEALPDGRLFFVAYEGPHSDVHELTPAGIVRRTDLTTGFFEVSPGPDGGLWGLVHLQGERRPALLRKERMLIIPAPPSPAPEPPAPIALRPLTDAVPYRPFAWENLDLGPIFALAGAGGGGFFGQVFASATDRLNNHALILNAGIFGSLELTNGILLYLNQERRVTWGAGPFQSLRFRLDQTFEGGTEPTANENRFLFTSGERFYGLQALARYPFSRFFYVQGELGVGGVSYFLDSYTAFRLQQNDAGDFYAPWLAANAGRRFQTELTAQIGYDTLRYGGWTGPIQGTGLLLELTGATQPFEGQQFGNARLDMERYFSIVGRTNFFLRGGVGTSFGGRFARAYYLSSFDTLRGVRFGDTDWLLGRNYFYSTAELQAPLNALIRVAFLSDLEAVLGVDFGGVGNSTRQLWDRRVLDAVVGVNVALGPLLLRLHFARPINTGAAAGLPVPEGDWVTNFSFGLAGLEGFFMDKAPRPRLGSGPYTSSPF